MTINGAATHLLINHFPVIGFPIVLLACLWGHARSEPAVSIFGVYLYVLTWLCTGLSYFTGEGAEHVLKKMGGVDSAAIHAHEKAALFGLILSSVLVPLALVQLDGIKAHLRFSKLSLSDTWSRRLFFVGLIGIVIGMAITAHLGGLIRHIELR